MDDSTFGTEKPSRLLKCREGIHLIFRAVDFLSADSASFWYLLIMIWLLKCGYLMSMIDTISQVSYFRVVIFGWMWREIVLVK